MTSDTAPACTAHPEHPATHTITWADGRVDHVCQPAANFADRWCATTATVNTGVHHNHPGPAASG